MKTYILKYPVYNSIEFPAGTIVSITDDYWPNAHNPNTGFTVMEGELKGHKGCVVNGLDGWLIDNTVANRRAFKIFMNDKKKLQDAIEVLNQRWDLLK